MVKRNFEPAEIKYSPPTGYASISSIPYTVAAALVEGRFTVEEVSDEAVKKTQILELARKVQRSVNTNFLDYQNAAVNITLKNGKTYKHSPEQAIGSPEMPASRKIIEDKFISSTKHVLSEERMQEVIDTVDKFDKLDDVSGLMRLLK